MATEDYDGECEDGEDSDDGSQRSLDLEGHCDNCGDELLDGECLFCTGQ